MDLEFIEQFLDKIEDDPEEYGSNVGLWKEAAKKYKWTLDEKAIGKAVVCETDEYQYQCFVRWLYRVNDRFRLMVGGKQVDGTMKEVDERFKPLLEDSLLIYIVEAGVLPKRDNYNEKNWLDETNAKV